MTDVMEALTKKLERIELKWKAELEAKLRRLQKESEENYECPKKACARCTMNTGHTNPTRTNTIRMQTAADRQEALEYVKAMIYGMDSGIQLNRLDMAERRKQLMRLQTGANRSKPALEEMIRQGDHDTNLLISAIQSTQRLRRDELIEQLQELTQQKYSSTTTRQHNELDGERCLMLRSNWKEQGIDAKRQYLADVKMAIRSVEQSEDAWQELQPTLDFIPTLTDLMTCNEEIQVRIRAAHKQLTKYREQFEVEMARMKKLTKLFKQLSREHQREVERLHTKYPNQSSTHEICHMIRNPEKEQRRRSNRHTRSITPKQLQTELPTTTAALSRKYAGEFSLFHH